MSARLTVAILGLFLVTGFSAPLSDNPHQDQTLGDRTHDGRLAPVLKNFGNYHRRVSTRSDDAQKFFDQGLILVYGFNHAEALRSFKEVVRLDPDCAMGHWGQALALAPNINDPFIGPDRERDGYQAIQATLKHKSGMTEVEIGLINAMALRFSRGPKLDRKALNKRYARAMKNLYSRVPGDPDVAALYAEAVLNTMPWDYWSKDGEPKPEAAQAIAALEKAIREYPDHPGAHHFYIHAVEGSNNPDRAVPSADRLGGLVPGAGHLVHMPAHIYIRVGRYADASDANVKAIAADEDYITQCRSQGIYPSAYYPHNIHFLFATLTMEGRSKDTLEAARKVSGVHGSSHFQEPGFGFPHLLRTMPMFGMIRFAHWDEILKEADPGPSQPFGQLIWHFARGLAFISGNRSAEAEAELQQLRKAARHPDLPNLKIFDLNDLAQLGFIAENLLAAEVAAKQNRMGDAEILARKAVAIEDNLLYSEPPDWPVPARHFLGAILLRAQKPKEAEAVYREDLTRHRNNGWSLYGLASSLKAQGRDDEAAQVERQFQQAWSRADMAISSSRL